MRKDFFTPEFYENPCLTLEVLNQLVEANLVADMDMYSSGNFLFMEVYENEETKNIITQVVSNLQAYKAYNNEHFVSDETTQIGLCALQDEHCHVFAKEGKAIGWDSESGEFIFIE